MLLRSTRGSSHTTTNRISLIITYSLLPLVSLFSSSSARKPMQVVRSDGVGGRGVTMIPHSGTYSNVVVFLHGLGDTADGWASMMPSLDIKDTKFILPTADSRPIALNGGSSMPGWSNIFGLDASSPEDKEGFDASAKRIASIVQAEVDKGISPTKVIVGGFSQGGATALHYALRAPMALGGCAALSSWLPFRSDYPAALASHTASMPMIIFHGTDDFVVHFDWGEGSYKLLKNMMPSNQITFVPIEGMQHSSDPHEMKLLREFILARFK